jgi:hypothetical protein
MEWVPEGAWLTKVAIDADAPQLGYDLAVDASGARSPSRVAAGLDLPGPGGLDPASLQWATGFVFTFVGIGGIMLLIRRRPTDFGSARPA